MQEFRRSVWIGFLWSIVFGTVLHFLYGWTGENRVVGLYAAISEKGFGTFILSVGRRWIGSMTGGAGFTHALR